MNNLNFWVQTEANLKHVANRVIFKEEVVQHELAASGHDLPRESHILAEHKQLDVAVYATVVLPQRVF